MDVSLCVVMMMMMMMMMMVMMMMMMMMMMIMIMIMMTSAFIPPITLLYCDTVQPAADFMNNLDSVFKRRIFDDEGAAEGGSLTTEQQLSIVAIVWRVVMLSRWDKNNFDGNDDLPWLSMVAAVLDDMRTDLLAFGIQVRVCSQPDMFPPCLLVQCYCFLLVFQGNKNPPSSVNRLGLLLSPTTLPLPLTGGGPALKISRSTDDAQNIKAMIGKVCVRLC